MRLIDAEPLEDDFQEWYKLFAWDDGGVEKSILARAIHIIQDAPTIEPKRKTGKMADYVDREDVRLTFRAVAPIIPWNTLDYILSLIPSAKQWIPCSERFPEKDKEVLICTTDGIVTDGVFEGIGEIIEWEGVMGDGCFDCDEVIAWMPSPDPYKEGENDE